MRDIVLQVDKVTSDLRVKLSCARRAASKPYVTVFLLVTILLSLWAGLCAA
jgi:hypothetical protein